MNREFLAEAALGVTAGLLITVLLAYRSGRAPRPGALRHGAMLGTLVYVVIALPVVVHRGMTAVGLIGILVVAILPVVGMRLATGRASGGAADEGSLVPWVRRLVGVGLATAVLVAGAQVISLLGRVDPRVFAVVLGVVAAVLVVGGGFAASGRAGTVGLCAGGLLALIAMAIGLFAGDVTPVFRPLVLVDGPSLAQWIALALAMLMLGWADPGMRALGRGPAWSSALVLGIPLLIVALIGLGLLMFYSGAVISPSMPGYTLLGNLDIIVGPAGLFLALLTMLFVAGLAHTVSGIGAEPSDAAPDYDGGPLVSARVAALGALVAVVITLFGPHVESVALAASLAAAALAGSQLRGGRSDRGLTAGLVAGVVGVIAIIVVTDELRFGWGSIIATIAVLVVSYASAGGQPRSGSPDSAEPQSASSTSG